MRAPFRRVEPAVGLVVPLPGRPVTPAEEEPEHPRDLPPQPALSGVEVFSVVFEGSSGRGNDAREYFWHRHSLYSDGYPCGLALSLNRGCGVKKASEKRFILLSTIAVQVSRSFRARTVDHLFFRRTMCYGFASSLHTRSARCRGSAPRPAPWRLGAGPP